MLTAASHALVVNTHTCMVFEAVAACGWIIEITEMDIANAGDLVLTSDGIRLFPIATSDSVETEAATHAIDLD